MSSSSILCQTCQEVGPLVFGDCLVCAGLREKQDTENAGPAEPRYNRLYPERERPEELNYTLDMDLCDQAAEPAVVNSPTLNPFGKSYQNQVFSGKTVKIPLLGNGPNIPLNYTNPLKENLQNSSNQPNREKKLVHTNRFGATAKRKYTPDPSGSAIQKKMNRIKNRDRIAQLERELSNEREEKFKKISRPICFTYVFFYRTDCNISEYFLWSAI